MAKSKQAIKTQVDKFNKKFKPGATIEYKTKDGTAKGVLNTPAVAQETQGSIYLKDTQGKVSLDKVTSNF